MNEKRKPKLGEILYSLNIGDDVRNRKQELTPVEVIKVGKKYFSCSERGLPFIKYHIDTWRQKTEFSENSRLYENPKEWEDEKESNRIKLRILDIFSRPISVRGISLGSLKKIEEIINSE